MIIIVSLNIKLGHAVVLEADLQSLHQGNVGIGFLKKKNLTERIHTRYIAGYKVWAMEVETRHLVGIAVICREDSGWQVKGETSFGLNVVNFTITAGRKGWYVVRAYVIPNNKTTCIEWFRP